MLELKLSSEMTWLWLYNSDKENDASERLIGSWSWLIVAPELTPTSGLHALYTSWLVGCPCNQIRILQQQVGIINRQVQSPRDSLHRCASISTLALFLPCKIYLVRTSDHKRLRSAAKVDRCYVPAENSVTSQFLLLHPGNIPWLGFLDASSG